MFLASAAKQRASIVPLPPPASTAESCEHRNTAEEQNPRPRNYTWAQLMARVFALDVLECPRCGSRMRILAAIEDPVVGPKDSRLPRLAVAAPSSGSRSPQPTPYAHRILTAHRPPSPTCASRPDGAGPGRRIAPFKSLCSPDNCSSGCPKSGFRGFGCPDLCRFPGSLPIAP
jgi:hypothetical protein